MPYKSFLPFSKFPTVALAVADYFKDHLPMDKWEYHVEVRRNYGSATCPNWQTVSVLKVNVPNIKQQVN